MVDFIRIKGNSVERGYQQGELLKDKIDYGIDFVFHSEMFLEVKPKLIPLFLVKLGLGYMGKLKIKKSLKKYLPNQFEKMIGIRKGSNMLKKLIYGLHYAEVISGNPKYVYKNLPFQSCSMIFALPEATIGGSMIFGRNYDFPNILQPFQIVRKEIPEDGYKNINLTQYPIVGCHMGLNEKGVAIGYNYGRSWKQNPLDFRLKGVPGTFIVQETLEKCSSTEEAVDFVSNFPARSNGCHYGIMDSSGNSCVIETTSTRFAIRYPEKGILAHTNHYQTKELKDANLPVHVRIKMENMNYSPIESPIRRYNREIKLLSKFNGQINIDTIKSILSDHNNQEPDEFTVCTHGLSAGTLASIIVLPKKKEFWVTDNHPCSSKYEKFQL